MGGGGLREEGEKITDLVCFHHPFPQKWNHKMAALHREEATADRRRPPPHRRLTTAALDLSALLLASFSHFARRHGLKPQTGGWLVPHF